MTTSVLVIQNEAAAPVAAAPLLSRAGYAVEVAHTGRSALAMLDESRYDAVLIDIEESPSESLEVLRFALGRHRCHAALMVAEPGTAEYAAREVRPGSADFITRPVAPDTLLSSLERVLIDSVGKVRRKAKCAALQAWRDKYLPDFIGESPKIIEALQVVRRVTNVDCDVLVTGPSGTGKELIARCLHQASPRADKPLVALNCAAIPKELMESEIFGHVRGAFTGASERRVGKFEAANGGSIFLDEVGEMDPVLQGKFLRVLQEREVTPIGDARHIKLDIRVISATNQNLLELCENKQFREDLFYRLNVIPIHLPALSERRDDVPLLAEHFIEAANRRHDRNIAGLGESAREALMAHDWPGNVRELRNLIERISILKADDGLIERDDLPPVILRPARANASHVMELPHDGLDINKTLTEVETRLTVDALRRANGNKAKAASLLGLKRTTLVERLRKLNIADEP